MILYVEEIAKKIANDLTASINTDKDIGFKQFYEERVLFCKNKINHLKQNLNIFNPFDWMLIINRDYFLNQWQQILDEHSLCLKKIDLKKMLIDELIAKNNELIELLRSYTSDKP